LVDKDTGGTLLYASSLNQIFAFRGIGKSVVANALIGALITGGEWLGFKAPNPRRVLLVDGELPAAQLQERLKEFTGSQDNLEILTPELMPDFPVLSDRRQQRMFLALIRRFDPEVIFIDTLSRCFQFDTNDADTWLIVNDFLIELRSRGYCVVLIHHAGKSGTQRGLTLGDDNLDVSVKLEPPYAWLPGDGLAFKWSYETVRHGGRLREFECEYLPDLKKWQAREDERLEDVLKLHREGKPTRSIAQALDISQPTVVRILQKARRQGLEELNKGKR